MRGVKGCAWGGPLFTVSTFFPCPALVGYSASGPACVRVGRVFVCVCVARRSVCEGRRGVSQKKRRGGWTFPLHTRNIKRERAACLVLCSTRGAPPSSPPFFIFAAWQVRGRGWASHWTGSAPACGFLFTRPGAARECTKRGGARRERSERGGVRAALKLFGGRRGRGPRPRLAAPPIPGDKELFVLPVCGQGASRAAVFPHPRLLSFLPPPSPAVAPSARPHPHSLAPKKPNSGHSLVTPTCLPWRPVGGRPPCCGRRWRPGGRRARLCWPTSSRSIIRG